MRIWFCIRLAVGFIAVAAAPFGAAVQPCTAASSTPNPAPLTQPSANDDYVTFKAAFVDPPKQLNRLADLPLELEDRRIMTSTANASLFHGLVKSEGELKYSPPLPGSINQRGNPDQRLMRFGMSGGQGAFRYGMAMREAGKAVLDGPDQASREIWGEWQVGVLRLRTSLNDGWNNVDKDQSRSRITLTNERVALTVVRPSWPELMLAYTRTALASSLDPQGIAAQQREIDTYEGAVGYSGPAWNARATAGYATNADALTPGLDTRAVMYGVNATYRVEKLLTLTPSLNLRDERQRWSGVRILSRSGSLSLAYTPDPHLSVTTLAGYNETSSTDHLLSLSNFNTTSTLTWKPESLAKIHASVSFETSHKVTHNTLPGAQSLEDTSGVVRLQFADVVIW